jgi:biotin carboxyl carrier protein
MEAAVRAELDGEVIEVLAHPGMTVDAKDLLLVLR